MCQRHTTGSPTDSASTRNRPTTAGLIAGLGLAMAASPAMAQSAPQQGGGAQFFIFMLILFGMMYFMMIRPQMKKAKQHRDMLADLHKGDEIVTGGGLLARVTDIGDNFVLIELDKGVQVKMQKNSVVAVLPKGSLGKL